jgi:UDP-N-acetylmuramyl pentapeptide phosphotransferase/UDP-N-acetylglucosamine-1-phosphate transferase
MSPLLTLIGVILACGLSLYALLGWKRLPVDHPNARSLHSAPTPRIGGLGIVAGVAVGLLLHWPPSLALLIWPALALLAISLADDYFDLPARWRLLVHLMAAIWLVWMLQLTVLEGVVALFALVWMSNLYNFMDGADGLAGGMALFGFGCLALLAWLAGDAGLAVLAAIVAAAALGFLLFNFPPARLFMGDAGSVPLGFLAAGVGLIGWQRGLWSWALPLLVFSPFIVDASVTLLKRGLRGERVWLAHREHYYQRLVRMGWSHRRLVLSEYALMLAVSASALWLSKNPQWQGAVILVWCAFYVLLMAVIDRRWRSFQHAA